MPVSTPVGFQDPAETQEFLIQASATNLNGFLINQDFEPEIEDIRRKTTTLWQRIGVKKPATAPIIKKIRKRGFRNIGFVPKSGLTDANVPQNAPGNNPQINQLDDPGQEVKAVSGTLEFEHFARSMQRQQGQPWEDTVAAETADLITGCYRFLDRKLHDGDASLPGNLEFNGIRHQIPQSGHIFTADITGTNPDSVVGKIDAIVTRAAAHPDVLRRPSAIYCSSNGANIIRDEVGQQVFYHNLIEITPGFQVAGVMTSIGLLPLITSPYLTDDDGGAGNDTVRFYIVDESGLEWHGVYPDGGDRTYEPQIFDITTFVNGIYLVQKRMILVYGTPYLADRGGCVYRLDVTAPPGTVWVVE